MKINKDMEKLVSIVIAVYNTENFLEKCLNSLLEQTYQNLEIIIVDDGSTDHSKDLILKYQNYDDRIKYFYQENQGPGIARNLGIKNASGDYLCFIDSDDWINNTFIEKLVYNIKPDDMVAICGTIKTDYVNESYCNVDKKLFETIRGIARFKKLIDLKKLKESNILFSKLYVCEDLEFYGKLFLYNPNYSIVDECLYYYYQRPGSLYNSFNDKHKDVFKAVASLKEFTSYLGKSEVYKELLEFVHVFHIIERYVLRGAKSGALSNKEMNQILDDIEVQYPNWDQNKYLLNDADITPEIFHHLKVLKQRDYQNLK